MISAKFLLGNVLLRGKLQMDAKISNFDIFESALCMKSVSMPLMFCQGLILHFLTYSTQGYARLVIHRSYGIHVFSNLNLSKIPKISRSSLLVLLEIRNLKKNGIQKCQCFCEPPCRFTSFNITILGALQTYTCKPKFQKNIFIYIF